jgi:chromosome segregation and condensation protein ScpB
MGRRPRLKEWFDTELAELPQDLRWREWMGRAEAVIFASPTPVSREALARVVGPDCNLDLLIDDIRAELVNRPYDLIAVAGGFHHRTRKRFAESIRASVGLADGVRSLSQQELLVLAMIAFYQPLSRGELSELLGREVSRDLIGRLRSLDLIAAGPRSPQPRAPYTFVTTKGFLMQFELDTLRDLPDIEQLEEAGLLNKDQMMTHLCLGSSDLVANDDTGEAVDGEIERPVQ